MSGKENPTEMGKLLIDLCDCDGDYTDRESINELVNYAKKSKEEEYVRKKKF